MKSVDVLLSTFNGDKYLEAQIESIISQEFSNWKLLVRDDMSSDNTLTILTRYKNLYPDKIFLFHDECGNLGVVKSFSLLMEKSKSEYVAFCDQDDVWLPNKLNTQLEFIVKAENEYGTNTPILIQSDLRVVDSDLNTLSASFWSYQNLEPENMMDLSVLMLHNFVTGCGCVINRKLLELSTPIPSGVIMHDWWIGLLAQSLGHIIVIDDKLVLYRQHGDNQVGANRWGKEMLLASLRFHFLSSLRKQLRVKSNQASLLLDLPDLGINEKKLITAFSGLFDKNWLARRVELIKSKLHMSGKLRNVVLFLMI